MSEDSYRLASVIVTVTAIAAYVGVLVYLTRSGKDGRIVKARQWIRYYRWRAWWDSLPTWKQEALIVRGGGP